MILMERTGGDRAIRMWFPRAPGKKEASEEGEGSSKVEGGVIYPKPEPTRTHDPCEFSLGMEFEDIGSGEGRNKRGELLIAEG